MLKCVHFFNFYFFFYVTFNHYQCTGLQLADMPSPLPRKPAKQKRLRSDNEDKTPEGPTPKKRGTRMRALTCEGGTPKTSRTKTALADSTFAENVVARAENVKAALQSEGRLVRCIDLSARGTTLLREFCMCYICQQCLFVSFFFNQLLIE